MKKTTTTKAAKATQKPAKKAVAPAKATAKKKGTTKPKAKKAAKTSAPRAESKTAKIIAMLERKGGATAAELLKATDWQAHSLRGVISGTLAKKMGRKAESTTNAKGERTDAL